MINNYRVALTESLTLTNHNSASVLKGDFSPPRHLPAGSPCQKVGRASVCRSLVLDQRYAEFTMGTCSEGPLSHCRPSGLSLIHI